MNDTEYMKSFADELLRYFEPKLRIAQSENVRYFRAQVVNNPGGNRLEVRRPFDDETILARCTDAMGSARAGDQVTVLVFGNLTNAVVISDGVVSTLGGSGGGGGGSGRFYVMTFSTNDWAGQTITIPSTTHGCGSAPVINVQALNGTSYEMYCGFPSEGWTIVTDAVGNIKLTVPNSGSVFAGRIIVSSINGPSGSVPYVKTFSVSDWNSQAVSVSASAHLRGTSPTVTVQVLNGTSYESYYGFPSEGWTVTIDASGNITLTVPQSGTEFAGRMIVQ